MSYSFSNTTNTATNNNNNFSQSDDSKNDIKPDNSVSIQDSISCLEWMNYNQSMPNNFFASVGWDSTFRLFEVNQANYGSSISQKATANIGTPALSCCWSPDNSQIYCGCIDGTIKSIDTTNMSVSNVGKMNTGISTLHMIPGQNILISTAYENNIQFWQNGNPSPVFTLDVGNKVFASDFKNNLYTCGTANEKIIFFDINNMQQKTVL